MSWNQGNYIIKSEEVKVKGKVERKVVTKIVRHLLLPGLEVLANEDGDVKGNIL
jgi:hypothetical protein